MNLDSLIKRGQPPWRPRPDAGDLDVWHEYEIPLVGTFRVCSDLVMFTQVLETAKGLSAWAYTCVSVSDEDQLADVTFPSADELRSFVETLFRGREAVLVLARDDRIIANWTRSLVKGGLVRTVEQFINDTMNQVSDSQQRVRAKFAGLDAAPPELVSTP
ncbi:hypothetical protein ACGFIV_28445 [Sphaerisporangium sp. NPDC049003]|uniref:hypothetical protein n=1 Tax=Sphaerisporangium sp. NPDC049003 TaxID=3364517 RepID=UPI00370F78C0